VPLTDGEIRRGVVETLYMRAKDNPEDPSLTKAELKVALKVTDDALDASLSKLVDRGLVLVEVETWESYTLSEEGLKAIGARELSYCPHL